MIQKAFFLFLLYFSGLIHANDFVQSIENSELWNHPHWHAILHYRKNFFGGYTSESNSKSFFYDADGRNNPRKELLANFKEFTKLESDIWCKFPVRGRFFEKYLDGFTAPHIECPELDAFRKKIAAKSLSLVFSSYYLDTPASAFGHTLLRIRKNKSHQNDNNDDYKLLDYAVNYAANVTTDNAFIYAILGLTGGFKGEYAVMPYFYKIREYNDYESRDLWDYELNLSQEQIDWAVEHIWEMKQTFFPYYYLSQNCSYHMMALLDVANPHLNLVKRTSYFVIPVETVKTLMETPGLVKNISFRPSKRKELQKRLENISKDEKKLLTRLMKNKNSDQIPHDFSTEKKVKILDAAIDFIDYLHAEDIAAEREEAMAWKNQFLVARAKTGIKTSPLELPLPIREGPHLGHGSRRLSLAQGYNDKQGAFSAFEYRMNLHDFLDPRLGQNPDATMEMGKFRLKYNYKNKKKYRRKNKLLFEHGTIANVISLAPLKPFFIKPSWRFFAGTKRLNEDICHYCLVPRVELAGGVSQRFGDFFYFIFLGMEADTHSKFKDRKYRLGIGPELTLNWNLNSKITWQIDGEYKRHYFVRNKDAYNFGSDLAYHLSNNFSLKIMGRKFENSRETALFIQSYF